MTRRAASAREKVAATGRRSIPMLLAALGLVPSLLGLASLVGWVGI